MKTNRGYILLAPNYVGSSAGIKALYVLVDELNQRGYSSFITGSVHTSDKLNAPLISMSAARELLKNGDFYAIYPETTPGNPLGAKRVIRWVLNRPGLLGGFPVYDDSELVFYYSDVYLDYIKNKVSGKLYLPTIDQSLFFDDGNPLSQRHLECFYVGKSIFQPGYFDLENVFEITREFPRKEELGKLFRASRVIYTFDNSTILTYEAVMCGCPVVVVPDGTQKREDYDKLELGMNGVAWGPEELDRARKTVHLMPPNYEKIKKEFHKQLDHFIELTQGAARTLSHCPNCEVLRNEMEGQYLHLDATYRLIEYYHTNHYFAFRRLLQRRVPRFEHLMVYLARYFIYFFRDLKVIYKMKKSPSLPDGVPPFPFKTLMTFVYGDCPPPEKRTQKQIK